MNKMFWQLFFLVPLSLGVLSGPALGQTDRRPPRPMPPIIGPGIVLQDPALIPIRLDAVKIDAQVHGNEAITRLELVFFNPNARVLEGELQFPLLAGQQVVGMAMDVRGALRDAVPVEKAKGQEVFEDVIRQNSGSILWRPNPASVWYCTCLKPCQCARKRSSFVCL